MTKNLTAFAASSSTSSLKTWKQELFTYRADTRPPHTYAAAVAASK